MSTTPENTAFATAVLAQMEQDDQSLAPVVERALKKFDAGTDWYAPIVREAMSLYEGLTGYPAPATFSNRLGDVLAKTKAPEDTYGDTARRLTKWVSTYLSNYAEYVAGDSGSTKTWITRHDDRVRAVHSALDGTTLASGARFDVGTAKLRFPGEPVGDPAGWINCRCVLKITKGDAMTAGAAKDIHRDAENEAPPVEEVDPADLPADDPDDDLIDADTQVPFHGVAAVVDRPTGDRRQLARDGFAFRPLPLPLFYQRAQGDGHGGSTVTGQMTRLALNEAGEVEFDGHFNYTPEAAEAIQGVAEGWLRGVSVDLDDIMVDYSAGITPEQAEGMSPEEISDAMQSELQVFKQWRIAGLTMVGIPAFKEAYIALGTRADAVAKKKPAAKPSDPAPNEDAPPVPAAKPGAKKVPTEEVQPSEGKDTPPPFPRKKAKPKADGETETFAPGTHDGPGWITAPVPTGRIRRYWVSGEGAAKIKWGVPGDFNRCREQLAKYVTNPEWLAGTCANMHKEAIGVWPGQEDGAHASRDTLLASGAKMAAAFNLVASAGPRTLPPLEFFQDPVLSGPTPITIEGERIFGHIATWGTCHIGLGETCTEAPHSETNYSWFRLGAVETDGGLVPVGQITMNTGHADLRASATSTAAHYDNTGTAVADIATGEDSYGIWFSGRVRPNATEDQRAELLAAKLSGDWRRISGSLELVAALAVNTPGFGIPRLALAASGAQQTSLVAAGIVEPDTETGPQPIVLADFERMIRDGVKAEMARRNRADALLVSSAVNRLRMIGDERRALRVAAARARFAKD